MKKGMVRVLATLLALVFLAGCAAQESVEPTDSPDLEAIYTDLVELVDLELENEAVPHSRSGYGALSPARGR